MRRVLIAVGVVAMFATGACASALAKDRTIIARNILPSGQYGTPSPNASAQAQMYNALTPLFDRISSNDLFTDFKSEKLSVDTDGPATQESVPFPGVTLLRDRFDVPHIYASTHAGGVETAGWILAEDRGLLLEQARYNSRVAAIDAPGLSAIGLISSLQSFKPSAQTEAVVSQQTKQLKRAGKEGKAVLRDIDSFIAGINAYLATTHSASAPWTRNDVYAVNALKGQFLGQGGGREAQNSEFLNGLQKQLGKGRGFQAFDDFRQFKNPRSVTSVNGNFPYGHIPRKHPGSVVLDNHSFTPTPAVPASIARRFATGPVQASNELMVTGRHSTTHHPVLVGGPQISYFFPGLVLEMDMHAPGLHWRGATSAPFPGYLLIGRTPRFSTTLTSASSDIIDQYAETLCGGSTQKYLYKGKCRDMGHFDAGTLNGKPVSFLTTVHGPVQGYGNGPRSLCRDLAEALELRQGRARPALLPSPVRRSGEEPEDLLQGRLADSADVQLVLHRPQAHRDVHERPRPDPAVAGRPGPADEGHRQVRVARLPQADGAHARQGQQDGLHDQLEQRRRPRLRRCRRRVEPQRLGRTGQPPQLQPQAAEEEGALVARHDRLGDERRRRPRTSARS